MPVTTRSQAKLLSGSTSEHLVSSSTSIIIRSSTLSLPLDNTLQCDLSFQSLDSVTSSIGIWNLIDHCGCYGSSFDDASTTLFHNLEISKFQTL